MRRREDVIARYWQRYCAKNDTIGFFGPLAWGSFGDELALRAGAREHARVVHFENWAVEAVAAAVPPLVPIGDARRGRKRWGTDDRLPGLHARPRAARSVSRSPSCCSCRSSSLPCGPSTWSAMSRGAPRSAARWSAARAGRRPQASCRVTADDLAAWARDRGLPRAVFARSPLERKPMYIG